MITDLRDDIYYATVHLTRGGAPMELDSRPSDAIALAIRAKVPVFVEDRVFDKSERVPGSPGGRGIGSSPMAGETARRPSRRTLRATVEEQQWAIQRRLEDIFAKLGEKFGELTGRVEVKVSRRPRSRRSAASPRPRASCGAS